MHNIHDGIKHKRVGYCHNQTHKGYITSQTLKSHKCLEKKCTFLQKFDCPYWDSYYMGLRHKQLRRYYFRHRNRFTISYDDFISKVRSFYSGDLSNVPLVKEKIVIDDYLDFLRKNKFMG